MWILVIGPEAALRRPESAANCLRELGCRVQTADFWDAMVVLEKESTPPTALFVEAQDQIDAGRLVLTQLKKNPTVAEVPALVAVTVQEVQRLNAADGFDDFVLIPYVPAELYVRIRRMEWKRSEFASNEQIKIGSLRMDVAAHEVTVDGRVIELTHQEFELLRFLCKHRGRVYTRQQLLSRVWGVRYDGGTRTVDIHVRRLRQKLGTALGPLETIRGVGYKMKKP